MNKKNLTPFLKLLVPNFYRLYRLGCFSVLAKNKYLVKKYLIIAMNSENIYRLISIDEYAVTPKYIQLSNSIVKAVEAGNLKKGYLLPTINDLSFELDISRDSAEKTYRHLKKLASLGLFPTRDILLPTLILNSPSKYFYCLIS